MRFLVAALLTLCSACNQSGFAGGGERKAADANPEQTEEPRPELGTKTKVDTKGVNDKTEEPGTDSATQDEPVPSTDDQANGDPNILDILTGLFGTESDIVPNQPDEYTIDLGQSRFFHIGDSDFDGTSCKLEVSLAALAGTQFYFEFSVKKDNTDVTLDIQRVCGVDYGNSNEVRILNVTTAKEVTKMVLPAGDAPIHVLGQGLAVGTYMVIVESLPNPEKRGDRDDYLVGQVLLKGTKPVTAGKVGAQ